MKGYFLTGLLFLIFTSVKSQNAVPAIDTIKLAEKPRIWQDAGYPGGFDKLHEYIRKNMRWPANAPGVVGKVTVSFVIEKDGSLSDIRVDRGLSPDFDKEAIRLVKESQKWVPCIQNGTLVRVVYSIPVIFKLNH